MTNKNPQDDIYFLPKYGKLYESIDKGSLEIFRYESDIGEVYYQFLKMPIEIELGAKQYFDISTPYGYGGPIIIRGEEKDKKRLVKEFYSVFDTYCKDNNIVTELTRFHPLIKNYEYFADVYNLELVRNTVALSLISEDNILSSMTKSCRKKLKKARRAGVIIDFDTNCDTIYKFINLYIGTMKKK